MDNTKYGNAVDFDVDLHSIYAAYLGMFENAGVDWWDKSWGGYFTTFNDFLGFGWEVMVVVDSGTGKPHIAVRTEQIALFAKMIRTRFGESLAKDPPTTLPLSPVPTRTLSLRRLITVTDLAAYRKLSQTLPAAELSYLRTRARAGDVGVAEQLFYAGGSSSERERGGVGVRDNGVGYSWACVKTVWWEKGGPPQGMVPGAGRTMGPKGPGGKGLALEVGIAVVRCANLRAVDVWPPSPEENYRKSHFITEEWVDKRANQNPPSYPRAYAFGRSKYVAEKNVEKIVDATLGALASQENDNSPNTLILLTVGEPSPLPVPAASTLPGNILHVDILALEFNLLRRAQQAGVPGTPDRHQPLNSLAALLQTLQIPVPHFAPLGNAGNDAYYTLLAFQKLMMAETRLPEVLFRQESMPMPFYAGYPSQSNLSFPQYGPLPMPPPIAFGHSHSRTSSNSSNKRQSELMRPPSPPGARQVRRASEHTRPRPVSMGDSLAHGSARPTTPENHAQSGSAPSTVRQPKRAPMPRSQTVFWDDAVYAGSAPGSPDAGERRRRESLRPRLKPSHTGGSGAERGRSDRLPPSAMRPIPGAASGRSVSWDERQGHPDIPVRPYAEPRDRSATPNRSQDNVASLPSSPMRNKPRLAGNSSSNLSAMGRGGESSSSTKISSSSEGKTGSGSASQESKEGTVLASSKGESGKDKEEAKRAKGKVNKERSVKDLAGALARFWVG